MLDPFCGVGTTNVVAQKLRRRSIGVDLSGEYLDVAARRLAGTPTPLPMEVE